MSEDDIDPIDDRMGEALRRHQHGLIRPLWEDLAEGELKQAWRRRGQDMREVIERCGLTIQFAAREQTRP